MFKQICSFVDLNALLEPTNLMKMKNTVLGQSAPSLTAGMVCSNIFIFMTVTNNIYQKQIKYHIFNAVTNSELTELVPVFTIVDHKNVVVPEALRRSSAGQT
jgi:hypothetical protein